MHSMACQALRQDLSLSCSGWPATLGAVVAPTITPADLIERLRDVFQARSDEDLAARLGIPLRSLSNYKNGQEMSFSRAVELLELAGWLTVDDDVASPAAKIRQARRAAAGLAAQAEALADILG